MLVCKHAVHQSASQESRALRADPGRNRGNCQYAHTPLPNGRGSQSNNYPGGRRIANCSPDPRLLEAMACHMNHTPHALGLIPEPLQYRAHTQHTRKNKPRSPTQA